MADGVKAAGEESSERTLAPIEFSATPILNRMLRPSADYLGVELKGLLKSSIEAVKAKLQPENVKEHIRQAFGTKEAGDPAEGPKGLKQLELFEKWVEGAENVSADGSPIAQMWQELLRRITSGGLDDEQLITTLKQLKPAEASVLLKFHRNDSPDFSTRQMFYLDNLSRLGLVEHRTWRSLLRTLPFLVGMTFIGYGIYLVLASTPFTKLLQTIPGTGLVMVGLYGIYLTRAVIIRPWRLTWMGEELLSYVKTDQGEARANRPVSAKDAPPKHPATG